MLNKKIYLYVCETVDVTIRNKNGHLTFLSVLGIVSVHERKSEVVIKKLIAVFYLILSHRIFRT